MNSTCKWYKWIEEKRAALLYVCTSRQRVLALSDIDEEQSEECCNGVLERESSRLTNGARSVFRVLVGASRTITSAPLGSQRRVAVSVVFFPLGSHRTSHSSERSLFLSLGVPPPLSYHPPSLAARLGARAAPVGWIWGRFPVAVGCNPEVHAEPSQSPPWACHVPDLWHAASEGHIGLLRQEALLLDAGQTEQPAGQQSSPSFVTPNSFV